MNLVSKKSMALRNSLPLLLLLAIPSCTDSAAPTMPVSESVFELRGPDGSHAVFRVAANARDPMLLESLHIPEDPSHSTSQTAAEGPRGNVILAAAVAVLTVYAAYETIRICVPPFVDDWVLRHSINLRTKEACFEQVAVSVASRGVATKVIPAVKVTAVRTSIKQMLGDLFTNRQLQSIFNKQTKPTVTKLAQMLYEEMFQKLVNGFKNVFNRALH